jgi:hypothetical protein
MNGLRESYEETLLLALLLVEQPKDLIRTRSIAFRVLSPSHKNVILVF